MLIFTHEKSFALIYRYRDICGMLTTKAGWEKDKHLLKSHLIAQAPAM